MMLHRMSLDEMKDMFGGHKITLDEAKSLAIQLLFYRIQMTSDTWLTNKRPNYFPGKSKPVSKRTARLWRGATITFK